MEYKEDYGLPTSMVMNLTDSCDLACKYCVTGDTQILMSNFSTKKIKDVKIGDKILGTEEEVASGHQFSLQPAEVLAISKRSVNEILQIAFVDGTVLNITDNHKVLNGRHKWTAASNLRKKTGKVYTLDYNKYSQDYDIYNLDYVKGYVTAMMFCDGSVKQYDYEDSGHHVRVRLAVKDDEIIDRMKVYFDLLNIEYTIRDFLISEKENLSKPAIFSSKQATYDTLIKFKDEIKQNWDNIDYLKGYLAAAYDAEGHIDGANRVIRICNSNSLILDTIEHGLKLLDIPCTREKGKQCPNVFTYNIRIKAGKTHANLDFIFQVKPAVRRKGYSNFWYTSLFTLGSIESIKKISGNFEVYNLTTECHTYIANKRVVHNCFVCQQPHYMSLEVAKDSVEWLMSKFKRKQELGLTNPDDTPSITYFGGEPTLLWDEIIVPLTEYIKDKYPEISLTMTTNGTLLNQDRINFMSTNRIYPLLSIDGNASIQDINRPTRSGKGSFQMVEPNIQELLWKFPNLTFRATVDAETCENLFENCYMYAMTRGFQYIYLCPNARGNWTKEAIDKFHFEINKIWTFWIGCYAEGKSPIGMSQIDKTFTSLLKLMRNNIAKISLPVDFSRNVYRCGLGTSSISVSYDGTLYGCQEQTSGLKSDTFRIGNIYDGIDVSRHLALIEPYTKHCRVISSEPQLCDNCNYRELCDEKICPSASIELYDDFFIRPKIDCLLSQWMFQAAQNAFSYLTSIDCKPFGDYIINLIERGL